MGNEGPVTLGLLVYPGEYPLGGPIERPEAGVYPQAHWSGATTPQLSGPPSPSTLPNLENTPRREPKATLEPSSGGLQSGPEKVLARLSTSLTLEANPNTCPGEQAGSWWVGGGAQGHWPAAMPLPARDEHAALHQHGPARIQVTAAPGLQHLPRARHREQESPFALGCG